MPVYLYRCLKCARDHEQVRSMAEPGLVACDCGGMVKRVYTASPVVFKGRGFYKTDSRKAS